VRIDASLQLFLPILPSPESLLADLLATVAEDSECITRLEKDVWPLLRAGIDERGGTISLTEVVGTGCAIAGPSAYRQRPALAGEAW